MEATTYSNFRKNLKDYMEQVNDNSDSLIVTSKDDKNVVVMAKSDYDNLMENMYLMSNEANREHINESMEQLEDGHYTTLSLEDI
ncbi:antitoxin YefM [Enterococcus sp. DIV0840]|uniref:type II toxin-antitoxin system Phd/YefM family antitoxin n=1 Tax=Enterococcus TaxID=1350 RepID=UPI001A8FF430|nr:MULTISPECIES: type II toxin-antitoxin system Phd/YefM family antitoxin [Enterococcus]MBO0435615.1 type II toxin-antitoxin system Phd/YefM family antitoxin [Enterococcus sp. DIV0849a]MBO0473021.1 type II toxin-antitoxin system Phd/YefM family antitoxin [Enterococcus ureasiticus]